MKIQRYNLIVCDVSFNGWILQKIAEDIFNNFPSPKKLIKLNSGKLLTYLEFYCYFFLSKKVVFVNQSTLRKTRIPSFLLSKKNAVVFYTHTNYSFDTFSFRQLHYIKKIVVMNSQEKLNLINAGLNGKKISVRVTGIDFEFFKPLNLKDNNRIVFVSQFHSRKRPEFILEIVKSFSQFQFVLIGHKWLGTKLLDELRHLPNFEFIEYDLRTYVHNLNRARIFLSVSKLEGGPIPLLESMACGLVPIATDTGWAPDIIINGVNGYVLPTDASVEAVMSSINLALKLNPINIRDSICEFTVQSFLNEF
jgi:glycosyltransferase involved in cell wall biosynthesis